MGTSIRSLDEIMKELSPDAQTQVKDFAEFLLKKKRRETQRTLRQDWAGALRDFRERYTSVELQKKSLEWRGD